MITRPILITVTVFTTLMLCQSAFAARGEAEILGTTMGSPITGMAYFQETNNGLEVTVALANVPPGYHGFHIHQFGSCNNTGKAAGSHYNPMGVNHGLLPLHGANNAHAGDLGNIHVGMNGQAALKLFLPGLSLTQGMFNVAGRSVILHELPDDFSQPLGNAGGRIGCGPIVLTNNRV